MGRVRKIITKFLPRKVKVFVSSFLRMKNITLPEGNRAFLFLAADYGNIGDLAITAAQQAFLEKFVPTHQVVLIPISSTRQVLRSIRKQVRPEDIVTTVGGGNMGSLYPDIEELRQLVIRSFPDNRIICFPQTLDWGESSESKRALGKIVRIYSRHKDLHLFARESVTFEKLCELFKERPSVKVGFSPDIVLSATAESLGANGGTEKRGALLCLRDDRERSLSDGHRQVLSKALTNLGLDIEVTDTHAGGSRLPPERCAQLLADKLSQFQSAELVVTDRLHGMILAALAGTPCLVLPNSNHKIQQTWEDWLANVPQVCFLKLDELAGIETIVRQLLDTPRRDSAQHTIDIAHYEELRMAIARI